ncbi:CTD small phosphatase-like protein 2-A isoform X2 [Brienomyrus brachyistius]|uniref:CTD small phosphatase-like protein 2-A isoform X2 n=1 Tax=Brienomyrus brachyistius TaxID=42636 RepID=UPI0020B2E2A4|nr:CTD small phosphatase-like protein 2-A isoform X2 [Brienomyrus brachyistius]
MISWLDCSRKPSMTFASHGDSEGERERGERELKLSSRLVSLWKCSLKHKEEAAAVVSSECSENDVPVVTQHSILQARPKRKASPAGKSRGVKFAEEEILNPDQCFFAYDAFCLISKEEPARVFNPYTFIKNIPSQSQLSKLSVREIPVKTRSTPEATLVLDLEETLVYSSLSIIEDAEYTFHTHFQDHEYEVFLILRPHVKEFLQRMSELFEIFVYTSAKRGYAEKILEMLDPDRRLFRHRLYREDCLCIYGHYVKHLSILERDLAKTVILDNAPHTFPYHVMNMIPIKGWVGEKDDRELQKLIPYLTKLAEADDFRHVLKKRLDHLHRLLSED